MPGLRRTGEEHDTPLIAFAEALPPAGARGKRLFSAPLFSSESFLGTGIMYNFPGVGWLFGRIFEVVIDVSAEDGAPPSANVTMIIGERMADVVTDADFEEVGLSIATYGNGSDEIVAGLGDNTWIAFE